MIDYLAFVSTLPEQEIQQLNDELNFNNKELQDKIGEINNLQVELANQKQEEENAEHIIKLPLLALQRVLNVVNLKCHIESALTADTIKENQLFQ